ncbi:MAG: protease family protein [Chloroflexota bacterium]|nr:protease family protein [Chloroflexota bacterium]
MDGSGVPSPPHGASWRRPLLALVIAAAALAVVLLGPRLFDTDPVGVDPFDLRLAGVALVLAGVAMVWGRLAEMRAVLLAVASVVLPYCAWSATPPMLARVAGGRLSFDAEVLVSDVVYLAGTLAIIAVALRWLPERWRPRLRLLGARPAVLAVAVLGVAAVVTIALALPAEPLGRLGIPVAALRRDLPLLGPAYVLQAAAQELQFRGLLLGVLERTMRPAAANAAQALLFGLAHVAVLYEGPASALVPITLVLGLVLGALTRWTGSLWPAIAIHSALEIGIAVAIIPGLYGQ